MPELPEVEASRRKVEEGALGRIIETVSLRPEGTLEGTSEGTLRSAFLGHTLTDTRRHGKHLFVRSGEPRHRWLRLHFGMSGAVVIYDRKAQEEPDHTRLRFDFERGTSLAWRCPRKFGRIGLVEDPATFARAEGLGPDVLDPDFGLRGFRALLADRSGAIKGVLLDQDALAGFGNVYADEALFRTGIHPTTPADRLEPEQVGKLWRAGRQVLDTTIARRVGRRPLPAGWLARHRDDGANCPRCGGTVRKTTVAGRSTYHCEAHQKAR